jgi:glycosyltransferase involved in cell wall biosynthesis
MNIGFDAKRAYHNQTGLGHYSRTLIHSLAKYFPGNDYFLFNPKRSFLFQFEEENVQEILPNGFPGSLFPSAWRSSWVKNDLKKLGIDIYHGLSHEIPMGLKTTRIKSVVTIHDLIHERFPDQYNAIDVKIYRKKFRYACLNSDRVIAISEQTKKDIVEFYQVPASKITVCYQSCNPAFGKTVPAEEKASIRKKYRLPERFFLHVGSIIERKNLLNVCKAIYLLRNEMAEPLVVIGDGGKYKQQVKEFIFQNGLAERIIFLSEIPEAKSSKAFQTAEDFPAIYQSAIAMIYPSFFEGFGIPVLEALWSRVPVITSNVSSLPEAGGGAAICVDPASVEEIASAMKRVCDDKEFAASLPEKGWQHAQRFSQENCAKDVMQVYNSLKIGD